MFEYTKYRGDTARSIAERQKRVAFWIGTLGLILDGFVLLTYAISDQMTLASALKIGAFGAILAMIVVSAIRNFHVKAILCSGLIAIFAAYWMSNFAEGFMGEAIPMDISLVLFIPLFVVIILDYRLQLVLASVQSVCVFFFTSKFGLAALGGDWVDQHGFSFSLTLAVLSGLSFVLMAVVAYSRDRADKKLYRVIVEKERLAQTDDLTGLINRRAFMDQLREFWPTHDTVCIAFVDLNHFKPLNDQYGHAVGDEVLRQVAKRIERSPHVRLCARLGGDEFAVLFEESARGPLLQSHVETLHENISRPLQWESGVIGIGASIGFAEGKTLEQSLSGLLRAADTAMRRAKSGRAHWAKFNPLIDNAAIASSTLEVELKSAIGNGQIRAAVQPIVDANSRDTVTFELLARWVNSQFERDPSPTDFIPIAEKLGLLNEILWVTLDEALSNLDLSSTKLAINVSPAQLLASDFIDCLIRILDRHQVPPHAITIEITEQVAFRNVDRNVAVLNQARDLGFEIALDDFGTGYSSLSMLDTLPLDKLKIDQSFVRKSKRSTQSKSILLAAIRLARQLGLESCVEGIETEQIARQIAALGADTMQGYLFGSPQLVQDRPAPLKLVS